MQPAYSIQTAALTDYGPIIETSSKVQRPGAVVWMDLLTNDVAAASRFYSDAFGWTIETSAGGEYAYATLNGRPVASIVAYDKELGEAEGLWLPSISVAMITTRLAPSSYALRTAATP